MSGSTRDHNGRGNLAASIQSLGQFVDRACIAAAAIAGAVIVGVAVTVTLSVVMRYIGIGGIRGDFEIVEMGCGIAAFLFLPLCQRKGNHVMVDIFSMAFPMQTRKLLDQVWEALFCLAWVIITWRVAYGLIDMYEYNDRSMLLRMPTWIVYGFALLGLGLSSLTALSNALEQFARPDPNNSQTETLK